MTMLLGLFIVLVGLTRGQELDHINTTTTSTTRNPTSQPALYGELRLVDGRNMYEGRLEIYYGGSWGTICDDDFHANDARVACRQMGMPDSNTSVYYGAFFGQGEGPIQLDELGCNGTETMLSACMHDGWRSHNCGHHEDVGIACNPLSDGELRLVNGRNMYEGRLEIYYDGSWGTICDDLFGIDNARVACRQMGMPDSNPVVHDMAFYGRGDDPIQLDDVVCLGIESRLSDCGHRGWRSHNCDHYEDVGIECNSDNIDTTTMSPTWDPTTGTTRRTGEEPAAVSDYNIHTAGTLIDPNRHGSNHCLRLVFRPLDRYANPGDLIVKFVPRSNWTSRSVLWQNSGEPARRWYSHNQNVHITTRGWIMVDDYNADANIEIVEQTITRGTCDFIET